MSIRPVARTLWLLLGLFALTSRLQAYTQTDLKTAQDSTIETIPLEATVQESPASISIKTYAAGTFTIYRKSPSVTSWGTAVATGITLGIEASWTDTAVSVGTLYEYRFVNTAGTVSNSVYPTGYILCGIKVDQTQPKGRMAIIVTPDVPATLPAEYAQYKADLIGDGWTVSEIPVPRCNSYVGLGNGALATVKVNAGGTGYVNGDIVTLTNPAGKRAVGKLTAASGPITIVSIPAGGAGTGFAAGDALTLSGGTAVGSGASLTGHVDLTQATVSSVSPVYGGSGYTDGQSVTLTGQTGGKTAQCTLHANAGVLSYFTVVSSQSGFVVGEVLTMTGNTTGSGAGAITVSSLTGTALASATLHPPGIGYTDGDLVTLTGTQSGKTIQATLHLNGIYIYYFTGYSSQSGFIPGEKLTITSASTGSGAGLFSCSLTGPLQSVTVNAGGTGYLNGNVVTINYGAVPAQGTLNVTAGAITSITVTSPGSGFYEGNGLSLTGLQSTATGANLSVLTVDNSNTGRAAIVGSGGSGYLDNDSVVLKGASSNATMNASIIAPGGVITGVSAVLPNTFTPGEALTITSSSAGSGFTGTAGPSVENHLLIRSAIQAVYNAYPGELKNIVMLGKVTALRTGINDGAGSDGHGNECPYGADAFYADMDSVVGTDWTDTQDNTTSFYSNYNLPGDKQFDQQTIFQVGNGAVELGFGRIDLSLSIQTETEALRTYFGKLHRYKIASPDFLPGRRVGDRATFGYPNEREADLQALPGIVGMNQIQFIKGSELPVVQGGQDADALYTNQHGPYLFYFKGSGGPTGAVGGKAVFWTGMQSHWGYWYNDGGASSGANTMQLRLAENSLCLSYTWNIWGLRYIYHRMGMGFDAGDMMKQSINNHGWSTGPYSYKFNNQSNGDYHGVLYMNHMGDPALRLFMFAPPSGLSVVNTGGNPALSWTASTDGSVIGYHVYRAANANAPYTRLTSVPIVATTYSDTSVSSGRFVYMVRAVHLENTGGGTFYNPSLGATQSVNLDAAPSAISILTTSVPNFGWNNAGSVTLAAQGGVPQYNWQVTGGTLPAGLSLTATGVLGGTPTAVGTFPVTVTATDQIGQFATQALSLVVNSNSATVLYPVATTFTNKALPTTSYGTAEAGLITGTSTYMYETFHRYDLSGVALNNSFAKATLYLYVTSGTLAGTYAPVQANLIADAQDGWVDNGIAKAFSGYSNNGAGKVRLNCPAHGFVTGTQVTIAGLTGTGAPVGPYALTYVDADNFDLPVTYVAGWAYDPALAFATTVSMTYNTRPTSYNPNVPTLTAQGVDNAGTLLQFDVTSYVRETLANDPAKKMSIRFFSGTAQTVATGTLRAFGGAIPYVVLETTNAPNIAVNSPLAEPAGILAGSSLLLDTTVTPLPSRAATLSLQWSKLTGPGAISFTKPTAAATGATFSTPGDYTLRLTANDGTAQSFRDFTVRVLNIPVTGPTDSMNLRFSLDETSGTIAHDSSGLSSPNNGTLTANPVANPVATWTTSGQISGGLAFSGTGQRIDVTDSTTNLLDGMAQMSISFWFKASSLPLTPNYAGLITKRLAAFNKESYVVELRGSTGANCTLYAYVSGGATLTSNTLFVANQWYHVALVFNGAASTNNLQLWVNGVPDKFLTVVPTTVPRNPTGNVHIGALDSSDPLGLNGTIDEVRIYRRALTQAEIQDLSAAAPANVGPVINAPGPFAGIAGHWFNLSATVTDDGKPASALTYRWSLLNGPGALAMDTPFSLATTASPAEPGSYSLQLAVSDGAISTFANLGANITGQTYNSWAVSQGLTGDSALSTAKLANDGLTNLEKYALGLNPNTAYPPGSPGLPAIQKLTIGGSGYLTLTFTGTATDVTYTVQATSDLSIPWTNLQVFPNGTAPGTVTVTDTQPAVDSTPRFLRLLISNP